jgi:hypothetical protein
MSDDWTTSMGIWVAIGIAIGVGIGAAMDNIGVGIAIGAGVGAALGTASTEWRHRKGDERGTDHA